MKNEPCLCDLEKVVGKPLVKTPVSTKFQWGRRWKYSHHLDHWLDTGENVTVYPGDILATRGNTLIAVLDI
jgi:hypothetical protein